MGFISIFLSLFISTICLAEESGFVVKDIQAKQAILEGKAKDIKLGDKLYSNKSPFEFVVSSVKDTTVTISVSNPGSLAVGNTLVKTPTEGIKKAMATEKRLKQTLDE